MNIAIIEDNQDIMMFMELSVFNLGQSVIRRWRSVPKNLVSMDFEDVDILITDYILSDSPRAFTGGDVVEFVNKFYPNIVCVIVSGLSAKYIEEQHPDANFFNITKPWTSEVFDGIMKVVMQVAESRKV